MYMEKFLNITETINKIIEIKGFAIVNVYGISMFPTIKENEKVVVNKCDEISIDDIVVFKYFSRILVHRVVKIEKNLLVIKGDNNNRSEIVKKNNIIGKVIKIIGVDGKSRPILTKE